MLVGSQERVGGGVVARPAPGSLPRRTELVRKLEEGPEPERRNARSWLEPGVTGTGVRVEGRLLLYPTEPSPGEARVDTRSRGDTGVLRPDPGRDESSDGKLGDGDTEDARWGTAGCVLSIWGSERSAARDGGILLTSSVSAARLKILS